MIMFDPVPVPQLKKYVTSCYMKLITRLTSSMQTLATNPPKFQAMLLSNMYTSTSEAELGIVINSTQVNSTDSITILGVIVGNKLNLNVHIYTLCAKAGKQLNTLQRLSKSLDKDSKLAKYKSFIMSNFNFCPVVWMFISIE